MELSPEAFTVVVCSDDEDGLRTRELAERWNADGLLGEFAWVTPEDVTEEPYGPPTILATVPGQPQPVELMTYLGMRPRVLIRLVLVQLLTHEHSDPSRLVEVSDRIADLVNRALPRRVASEGGSRATRLLRVNLMVPESDLRPQGRELILPKWEVNAIVSPEDRPDLDRMSVFVRRSANLHGHALAAAASAGGLWADSGVGAFDRLESDSTSGGGEVMVMRSQARMVVGDDRSEELAASVINGLMGSQLGAASWVNWAVPAENPAAVARVSVERLMAHPEWAPRSREPRPLEKAQLPLGTLLRNWALFQLSLPLAVLRFVFGVGRSAVERSVTAATVGRNAGEEGRVRPLTPDEVHAVAQHRFSLLRDELEPARLEDEAASWGQRTPSAWRELRELAIGLVDGSRLPDRFSRATRGGSLELLPPGAVMPPPNEVFELPDGTVLRGVDVRTAARWVERLGIEVEEPEPLEELLEGPDFAEFQETQASSPEPAAPPVDEVAPSSETAGEASSEAAEAAADEAETSDEAGAEAVVESAENDVEVADVEESEPAEGGEATVVPEEEPVAPPPPPAAPRPQVVVPEPPMTLSAWLRRRKLTLLWQVSEKAAAQLQHEQSRAQASKEELDSLGTPSTDRLQTTEGLLKLAWVMTAMGVLLLGFYVLAEAQADAYDFFRRIPEVDWVVVGRIAVLVVAALILVGSLYFQALRAYEWEVTRRLHRMRVASDEYVIARQEERRWRMMYAGIQDWAIVFGQLLHRPWQPPSLRAHDQVQYEGLPAAVAVAVPIESTEGPDTRLVARAIEHVCQKGWLQEEFARLVQASPSNDAAANPHSGDLPADLDLGLRPRGPRRELAEVSLSSSTKSAATRQLLTKLAELLRDGDVRLPPQTVVRTGPHSAGDPSSDRNFFTLATRDVAPFITELFSDSALLAKYNVPERAVYCVPPGVPADGVPARDVVVCGSSVAVRVDLSPLIPADNITLFTRSQRQEAGPMIGVDDFN